MRKSAYRNYIVESRAFQWSQWSEWSYDAVYFARDASEAKKLARASAIRAGWTRQDGKLEFRARLSDVQS